MLYTKHYLGSYKGHAIIQDAKTPASHTSDSGSFPEQAAPVSFKVDSYDETFLWG